MSCSVLGLRTFSECLLPARGCLDLSAWPAVLPCVRCGSHSKTTSLEQINTESLDKLREIHRYYRAADAMGDDSSGGDGGVDQSLEWRRVVDWAGLEALLAEAELAIKASDGRAEKHALVLQTTQLYCVRLGAARVTCCKSGKDRTGMVRERGVIVFFEHIQLVNAVCRPLPCRSSISNVIWFAVFDA